MLTGAMAGFTSRQAERVRESEKSGRRMASARFFPAVLAEVCRLKPTDCGTADVDTPAAPSRFRCDLLNDQICREPIGVGEEEFLHRPQRLDRTCVNTLRAEPAADARLIAGGAPRKPFGDSDGAIRSCRTAASSAFPRRFRASDRRRSRRIRPTWTGSHESMGLCSAAARCGRR